MEILEREKGNKARTARALGINTSQPVSAVGKVRHRGAPISLTFLAELGRSSIFRLPLVLCLNARSSYYISAHGVAATVRLIGSRRTSGVSLTRCR